jgi:anthranilate synthase component 1
MPIKPSREEFAAQAVPGAVVPVWEEFNADLETPVSAYLKISSRFPTDHFLLESVEGGEKWARYSFIGFDPHLQFRAAGAEVTVARGGKAEDLRVEGDPLALLSDILSRVRYQPARGLPRLSGGAVGLIGYDYARHIERIPDTHPAEGMPDALFMFPRRLVIFDNVRHTIIIVAHGDIGEGERPGEAYERCVRAIEETRDLLSGPLPYTDVPPEGDGGEADFEMGRDGFMARVRRAKEYIRDGEIIQVVLSDRAKIRTHRSPSEVYRVLRSLNPSPYMFLLRFGGLAVVGSSPEVLVRLEGDLVQLRPIAGTRPRGGDPEEDRRLESELLSDPKEIAEHVMLVDLGRNDVGRVSRWGSVKVDEMMVVERYSHVMHIVSNVTGRLAGGKTGFDVLRATFPAGTLTGAPKVRAMEIIEELEPFRRGIYGGAIGYFDMQGNMDFCIAIRTVVMRGGEAVVQAGAGIVADSDPEKEWDEIRSKARILFRAAGDGGRREGRNRK